MNAYKIMQIAILVASTGAIIKGVLMIGWPGMAARLLRWWLGLSVRLLRVVGTLTVVLGLVCIVAAAMAAGNAIIAVTLILGTLAIIGGIAYHSPDVLRTLARPWTGKNPVLTRITGVVAVMIALVLLWVLFRHQ